MIRIMNLPNHRIETLQRNKICDFSEDDAQGLTYAQDTTQFLSSEKNIFKWSVEGTDLYMQTKVHCLKKESLSDLLEEAGFNKDEFDHIGEVDYFDGFVFVPVRQLFGQESICPLSG